MRNSVERENPIQDSGDQEILEKLSVEGKKNPKHKTQTGGRSRFNFPGPPSENRRVYILRISV